MSKAMDGQRLGLMRAAIMGVLVLAYAVIGVYAHLVLRTDIVYTHFAYIPIALAGLWWGRKGIFIALLLAAITFFSRFISPETSPIWSDLLRTLFFLIVAGCIGLLSENVTRARKALGASEEKYRLLIDNSLAGIFVQRDDRVLFANQRFCELLGYGAEELIDRPISAFIYEPDRRRCSELLSVRQAPDQTSFHYECRFLRRDRKIVWADVSSSITSYERKPALLVNLYDVTDRKEAEDKRKELSELARRQEEQLVHSARLAELGEMAASVAHELNQPLTGIRNYAKNTMYMIDENIGGPQELKSNLKLIADQVDRASRIINQMRSLTRKSDHVFTRLDLNRTISESVDFISPQLKLDGIKVNFELASCLPPVMADKTRLEQVFLNILTNARQAMEEAPERRLGVKTYHEPEARLPVVLEIADTGKGFAPEEADKLFAPFYTTKKLGEGTGLGLSISLTIIKEHKGEIEAIGAPGVGSIFKVMLPAAEAEPEWRGQHAEVHG